MAHGGQADKEAGGVKMREARGDPLQRQRTGACGLICWRRKGAQRGRGQKRSGRQEQKAFVHRESEKAEPFRLGMAQFNGQRGIYVGLDGANVRGSGGAG